MDICGTFYWDYSSLRDFILRLLFGLFSLLGVLVLVLTQFNRDIFPFITSLFEHLIGIFLGLFIKRLFYWDFLRGGNNEAATCLRILLVWFLLSWIWIWGGGLSSSWALFNFFFNSYFISISSWVLINSFFFSSFKSSENRDSLWFSLSCPPHFPLTHPDDNQYKLELLLSGKSI